MTYLPQFSTQESNADINKIIYVETINGFPKPVSGVITLEDGVKYVLTREVDIDSNRFVIPDEGACEITSDNLISNTLLVSLTGSTPLFSGNISRLIIQNIDIDMSSGGNLFDINSNLVPLPLVQIMNGRIFGSNAIGSISGALTLIRQLAFINFDEGIVLSDNGLFENIGILIEEVNFVNVGGDQVTLNGSQSFVTVKNCLSVPRSGGFFLNMPAIGVVMTILASPSVIISENTVNTTFGGGFLKPGSVDQSFPESSFKRNSPLQDSYRSGGFYLTENFSTTLISVTDTYADILGGAVGWPEILNFIFSNFPNKIEYIGIPKIGAQVNFNVSIRRVSAQANVVVRVSVFKDSGLGFVEVPGLNVSTTCNANRREASFSGMITLVKGDIIKAMVKNETNTVDLIIDDMHLNIQEIS